MIDWVGLDQSRLLELNRRIALAPAGAAAQSGLGRSQPYQHPGFLWM
jgi:hypothetical protein